MIQPNVAIVIILLVLITLCILAGLFIMKAQMALRVWAREQAAVQGQGG
jgi:hypothetical protein